MAEEVKELSVFPMGEENPFGQYFTGKSYRKALSSEQVKVSNITFTPGCRNHWHIHHAETGGGQMLLVTAGRGWYQAATSSIDAYERSHRGARVVPGVGEAGPGTEARRRRQYPGKRQALARRGEGQLVPAYRDRGPGHQDKYRVV